MTLVHSTSRASISKILLKRCEGTGPFETFELSSFTQANALLDSWRQPGDTHVDKCDFTVFWSDDDKSEWAGCYMLDHSKQSQSLNGHIHWYARWQAGLERPDSYNDENWAHHLGNIEGSKQDFLTFLDNFNLADKP